MSVVVRREHPSGEVGISVAGFTDDQSVVVGVGDLRDMHYIKLSPREAMDVSDAIDNAIEGVVPFREYISLALESVVNG